MRKNLNWIPLIGVAEVAKTKITYRSTRIREGEYEGQSAVAVVKSNCSFETGEISFDVKLGDPNSACQVVLSHGLQPEIYVGLGAAANPYVIALYQGRKWEFLAAAGTGNLPTDRSIAVHIRVRGSEIELFVDKIKVCSAVRTIQVSQLALFLNGPKDLTVSQFRVQAHQAKAFVVMQFSDQFDALYSDVIEPTCEKFGFKVERADDIYRSGSIIEDIVRSIRESSFVIADMTPDNPNVFYEVGYAHGIGKPTILLSDRRRDKLPFDVSGFRTLFYDNTIGGKKAVEESLTKHLENMTV